MCRQLSDQTRHTTILRAMMWHTYSREEALGRRFVRGRGLRDAAIQRRRSSESASSECWSPQRLRDLSPGVRVVRDGDTIES